MRSVGRRIFDFYWGQGIADDVPALTYYLLLSLAPFALGLAAVQALLLKNVLSAIQVAEQINRFLPDAVHSDITRLVLGTRSNSPLLLALAVVTMLWTSSGAIGVLERCESRMLGAPRHSIVVGRIRNLMLGAGVALMVAAASAAAPVIGDAADAINARGSLPGGALLAANTIGSIFVFAAIYRWAPRATMRWRSAIVGAIPAGVAIQAIPALVGLYVGLREGSKSADGAREGGFQVLPVAEAASRGDIVMVLVPDELHHDVYEREIRDGIAEGNTLLFGHGFSVHYGEVEPPPGVDVGLVAPKGPGHLVRRQYTEGSGVPCLIAVAQDASGRAKDVALAYAKGIGGTRGGVIETTFKDETETDLFGEQAVLCGGASELVQAGFETLVEAGYDPQMAYFECLHELKLIVDLMYEKGLQGMRFSISNTAEYGDYTRGKRVITEETRARMKDILREIQSGDFAREWIAENRAGQENFKRMRAEQAGTQVEKVGEELRSHMDWIKPSF